MFDTAINILFFNEIILKSYRKVYMKSSARCLLLVIGIIAGIIGLTSIGLVFAGYWLQSGDTPVQSDAIIVLAGEPARAFYAADLYHDGYAPQVYISKPVREHSVRMLDDAGIPFPRAEDIYRLILLKKGVPAQDIHIFGEALVSTVDEAEAINKLFTGNKSRLLVVTSPYHTRRTQMIFNDIVTGSEIDVVGTPYEPFPKQWWKRQDSARNVILEIVKILFYQTGGRFTSGNVSTT